MCICSKFKILDFGEAPPKEIHGGCPPGFGHLAQRRSGILEFLTFANLSFVKNSTIIEMH